MQSGVLSTRCEKLKASRPPEREGAARRQVNRYQIRNVGAPPPIPQQPGCPHPKPSQSSTTKDPPTTCSPAPYAANAPLYKPQPAPATAAPQAPSPQSNPAPCAAQTHPDTAAARS